jgi:nicotinate-nucleotide pyrophosphorylase (carboxylating)
MDYFSLDPMIRAALFEDIGTGDITTLSTIDSNVVATGTFIAKEKGVLCGIPVVERVFNILDPHCHLTTYYQDGDCVKPGDIIAVIKGNARILLTGERVALNYFQRLSGIATKTREAVKKVSKTKAIIADTRKTTPGLRVLEKYAVKIGGGSNHRFNLSDGILIKDNHIRAAGSITNAVKAVRNEAPHTLKIEVETESFEQIKEALLCKADIIMLDNMSVEQMKQAVMMIDGRALVEASGNMGDQDLLKVAMTGVDIISIGALTHTVKALDISLKFSGEEIGGFQT